MQGFLILRHDLDDDPHVLHLMDLLMLDVDTALIKLRRLWRHADLHTSDGLIPYATRESVDRLVGIPGFAQALVDVGWLELDITGARVARFEEWMGVEGVRGALRRFDKAHPPKPRSRENHPGFAEFWSAYPKKKARGEALKAWNTLKPSDDVLCQIKLAIRLERQSEQWLKQRGQFIPYPATWLRREPWREGDVGGPREGGSDGSGDGLGQPGRVRADPGKYAEFGGQEVQATAASERAEGGLFSRQDPRDADDPFAAPQHDARPGEG